MKTLRAESVAKKLDIGLSTVWKFAKMNIGFPQPFQLTKNVTVWDEADIDSWLLTRKQGDLHDETVGSQDGRPGEDLHPTA